MKELQQIKERVEQEFNIENLAIKSRTLHICTAKAIYYELALLSTRYPIYKIARYIGKHHATAINAKAKLPVYLKESHLVRSSFDRLCVEYNVATKEQIKSVVAKDQKAIVQEQLDALRLGNPDYTGFEKILGLIMNIPTKHIKTVEDRMKPIIQMLPA